MAAHGRDARLALLAGRQAGAFSFAQAVQLGYPSSTVGRRLASRAWERRHPGVYGVGGSEQTRLHRLWAATLAVGQVSALTHETCALIHGAERLPEDPITLTGPHRWHHRLDEVFVHQIDDLLPQHCERWNGLLISRPARVVVELGATQSVAVIGRVADDFVRLRKTTYPAIQTMFSQIARPGKPGVERVARVLDERGDGHVPPSSELERALFEALAAGGLPAPVRQIPLPGRGRINGIADAGYPDARLILEVDGRRWHARVHALRHDAHRDAEAARVGWQTLRVGYELIVFDPAELCATVSDTRAVRLQQLNRAA